MENETPVAPPREIPANWAPMLEQGLELLAEIRRDRKSERFWRFMRRSTLLGIALALGFVQFVSVGGIHWFPADPVSPTVTVIDIAGEISANGRMSADTIVPLIQTSCASSRVAGVILHVNSPGGSPSEAERIGRAIDNCRTGKTPKAVDVVVEGLDASAAYMISIHADHIIANPYALVGSIGAIITTMDGETLLDRIGVRGNVYASGNLKAIGTWFKKDTPEQARAAQSIVDSAAALFRSEVQERRGARLKSDPQMFTGKVWPAREALTLGLIDEVDVIDHFVETHYAGKSVQRLVPRRPLSQSLGLDALVHTVASEMIQTMQEWQWR